MQKHILFLLLCVTVLWADAQIFPQLGGQRAGISALSFLKIDASPRSVGVAGANVCLTGDALSSYANPAAAAELEGFAMGLSNTFWVAGIRHNFFSVSDEFSFGTMGLSVTSLGSGAMKRRTEFQPGGTGENFYVNSTAVGLTYSKRLTNMFSYGMTIKYVNETLAEYQAHTGVIDLGFLYRTDFKDLRFAVMLQNFGLNSRLNGEYIKDSTFNSRPVSPDAYPAPTIFKIGVSITAYEDEKHRVNTALQLNHPNDNAENVRLGVEYCYRDLLFLRTGYKVNVQGQRVPTFGVGLRSRVGRHPLYIDYAADPMGNLGLIHRIGLMFELNKEERE